MFSKLLNNYTNVASLERDQDILLPYVKNQQILQVLQEQGYYVVKGVFSKEACIKYVSGIWDFVEQVNPKVNRKEPATQYRKQGDPYDPWPDTVGGLFHTNGAGWCQSLCDIREQAAPIFEQIYDTEKLHCSNDGMIFSRPPRKHSEYEFQEPKLHFEQGSASRGLQCIQASVCLINQQKGDGCFVCIPGSHKNHNDIMNIAIRSQKAAHHLDFYSLTKAEQQILCVKTGQTPKCIYLEAGDMIFWRSDLAHGELAATKPSDRYKAMAAVCMLPASLTSQGVLLKKKETWQKMYTTSHWPNKEKWFQLKDMRPFNMGNRPTLTYRQKQLFGLEPYTDEM
eukprot:TRINITY_DN2570_c0_g1_i3.p2 TRINITY_DN2570_c0_g1~~TRINITY_DN2570_c0_g1_i3.p2  ORF type:complete len:339 (+),score=12.62 TRINITY_DN2570_c0_g1_i3:291-1307(+)